MSVAMQNNESEKEPEGMEELKKFYEMKKNEQKALRKLLDQLNKKLKNENSKPNE